MSEARTSVHIAATRHCGACWYDLNGLGAKGRCPECGMGFDRELAVAERRREERVEACRARGWGATRDSWERWRPSAWTVAVALLVLGMAAVLAGFGWVAVVKFDRVVNHWW